MSTIEERVNGYLSSMAEHVKQAESVKESGQAVLTFHKALAAVVKVLDTQSITDRLTVLSAIDEAKATEGMAEAISTFREVNTFLAVASGTDRTEGDETAKKLTMAVESGLLEGETRDKAEKLLASWKDSAPKGTKGTGSSGGSSTPSGRALPFPVKVTCEADGWSARQTGNVNSLRWAAITHHGEKHGHKPAKGDAVHTGLTEAILSVCDEKSASAQGGGYLVDKA